MAPRLEGTTASAALCREVSRLSGGTVLLGFSRGKDSIAAWLWLRQLGIRVLPFHLAGIPGLSFVDRSLAYYEQWFATPIERLIEGSLYDSIGSLVYQPGEDEAWIDALDLWGYNNHYAADWMRRKYGVPGAWVAWGINLTDSIDRRIYVTKYQGRIESNRSFYPCFDWTKKQIMAAIRENEIRLPDDYLLSSRSFTGVPRVRTLTRLKEVFPEDFERVKLFFPMCEAALARNEFRRQDQTEADQKDQAGP